LFPETLTWRDMQEYVKSGKDAILLPIGSMEGHGYHLPLNTDTVIAEEIATRVAKKEGLISIQPLTYTIAVRGRVGNVEMSESVFKGMVMEVMENYMTFGLKRLIIVLGHGGPTMRRALVEVASDLASKNPNLHVSILHILRIVPLISSLDVSRDTHAGEWETSLMLHLKPEVVGEERVKEFDLPSRHGVHGDPTIATREKGEELTAKIVDWIANWIKEKSNETGLFHLFKDVPQAYIDISKPPRTSLSELAAGKLILEEAGGIVTDMSGKPFEDLLSYDNAINVIYARDRTAYELIFRQVRV